MAAVASTAFDEHPYPRKSMYPSRPEWVLGPPSHSTISRRRSSASRRSISPSPLRPRFAPTQPSPPKAASHLAAPQYPPTPHPRHGRSHSDAGLRPGPSHAHNRARSHSRKRSPPPPARDEKEQRHDPRDLTLMRRPSRSRSTARNGDAWAVSTREKGPVVRYRSRRSSSTSSSSSSSDDERKTSRNRAYDPAEWEEMKAKRNARNAKLFATTMACVTTVSAANNVYQANKAYQERRRDRGAGAEMTEKERRDKLRKHLMANAVAVGVGGIVLNNARKGWVRARDAGK